MWVSDGKKELSSMLISVEFPNLHILWLATELDGFLTWLLLGLVTTILNLLHLHLYARGFNPAMLNIQLWRLIGIRCLSLFTRN